MLLINSLIDFLTSNFEIIKDNSLIDFSPLIFLLLKSYIIAIILIVIKERSSKSSKINYKARRISFLRYFFLSKT